MNLKHLSHSTRRFLSERLERLHSALESLGQRLRESIAQLVGSHIGEAVQDALATALLKRPLTRATLGGYESRRYPHDDYHRYREEAPYHTRDDDNWGDEEPEPPLPPPPKKPQQSSRWRSVLAGGVHLATLWYQHRPPRRSLLRFLGLGVVDAIVTLAAGTLIGGIVATAGTALLLTASRNASNARSVQSSAGTVCSGG
jgi:hypothetical protein